MDGLTVGYGEGDVEQTTGTKSNESTLFAKYTLGSATVGIQMSEKDNESASDVETTGIGISYQVNDDLAISYGSNTMENTGLQGLTTPYARGVAAGSVKCHQTQTNH